MSEVKIPKSPILLTLQGESLFYLNIFNLKTIHEQI